MAQDLRADYGEQWLFPPCLEDWVGKDHPARFVREFVDSLDLLALGFPPRTSEDGRPPYATELLLKVWLYGYLNRIRSSRGLERACREHLSLIWLTGNQAPDHNTLWRFWHTHQAGLRAVFDQVVRVAVRSGLVNMVLHAVDGTKIVAQGSMRATLSATQLAELLSAVEASLKQTEQEIVAAEQREQGEYRLPEDLADRQKLRQAITEALAEIDPEEKGRRHPGELEARVMKCGRQQDLAYNAQAAVESSRGLIVAQEVVNAGSDNHQLVPMLEQVEKALGTTAEQTVADGGYCSGKTLAAAEEKSFPVLVNLPAEMRADPAQPYASAQFRYDAERDVCVCPQGKELPFRRERDKPGRGYRVREYRCTVFRQCPVRDLCSRDRQGRRVEIAPYHEALERQRQKIEQPEHRNQLRRRKVIIEPVFAWIKDGLAFRRFTVRGLEGARTQWAVVCTAMNLKKLMPFWQQRRLVWA